MKSEYKTFREAYEAYVNPKTRKYEWLCDFLIDSPELKQKFKEYYDPKLYSELVEKTDQYFLVFMRCRNDFGIITLQEETNRRATALAFLAAIEEEGDL